MNTAAANTPRFRWRNWLARLAVLGACVVALPMLADGLIYFPEHGSRRAITGLQKVPSEVGDIALLHLPNPHARFTLWFFHGNAEDLGDLEPFLLALRNAGYAVFAFDYPGYGQSTGKPSEKSLYAASRAARTYLRDTLKVSAERTILLGRSLGGGPALQMAVEEQNAGVVLQSTFTSAFRVVTRWRLLPGDPFQNLGKIKKLRCPLLVMHGRADEVIAFHHGEALYAAASEPKRHLWVEGARHNDFIRVAGAAYGRALKEFSELCAQTIDAQRPADSGGRTPR